MKNGLAVLNISRQRVHEIGVGGPFVKLEGGGIYE